MIVKEKGSLRTIRCACSSHCSPSCCSYGKVEVNDEATPPVVPVCHILVSSPKRRGKLEGKDRQKKKQRVTKMVALTWNTL